MRAKRVFSILLAAVLALSLLPSAALAEGDGPAGTGWTPLTDAVSGNITSTTNYYLEGDVVLSKYITAVGEGVEVTIDLRGHKLSGAALKTRTNGTLTILDTVGGGSIEQQNAIQPEGGTVNIRGGTIDGLSGSAIKTTSSGAMINISGGTLTSNSTTAAAVYVAGDELHISGGTIGDENTKYCVQLAEGAELYLSGEPTFAWKSGTQFSAGAAIYLAGSSSNSAINNAIHAADGGDAYTGGKLDIALSGSNWGFEKDDENVTIVRSVSVENYDKFALLGIEDGKGLNFNDTAGTLVYGTYVPYVPKHTHDVTGGTGGEAVTWNELTKETLGYTYELSTGNYYLSENLTVSRPITIIGDVKLCLNGKTLSGSGNSTLDVSGTSANLTICDCGDAGQVKNTAQNGQSAVDVGASKTLKLYGGRLDGGSHRGVSTSSNSKVYIYGGTIAGTDAEHGALEISGADVYMTGGNVAGNVNLESAGELYLGGNPEISGNVVFVHESCKLHAAANDTPYSGGDVRIDYKPTPTDETAVVYGVNNENEGKFTLVYPEDKYLIPSEGNLVFSSTPPADEHTHGVDGGTGDIEWTAWDGTTNLTAGNYYIENNITLSKTINVSGAVNLCLNGKTISYSGSSSTGKKHVFSVNGTFSVCDCKGGGEIQQLSNSAASYYTIEVKAYATFNLYGGTITAEGNSVAVHTVQQGTINVYGGSIEGTTYQGAITSSGGEVTIAGGSVSKIWMQGTELYLTGAPVIGSVYLNKNENVQIPNKVYAAKEGENYSGGNVTISTNEQNIVSGTVIVHDVSDSNADKFTFTGYELEKVDNDLVVKDPDTPTGHKHAVDGSAGTQTWTEWDGKTNLTAAGYYYLAENAEPTAAIEVTADVHLCLNGKTISREKTSGSEVFKVTGKLTICDCSEEGTGEVKININSNSAAVRLTNYGKLTLYGGTLDGGSGNGVFASGSSTKVTITGGAVMGKRDNGCALGLDSATATITGGTVEGVRLQGIYGKLYLGGNPSVGPVLLYTTDGSAIYKSQIHAVANDVPYTGNTITINTKYKNMAPDTDIVYNVNDDNASKFTLTDYQLERKENNLVIAKNKDITLNVTVPALNYGDTKPLEIEVVPADATLTYKVTGKTPSDTSTAIKVEDGQITAGAVGNFILTVTATADGYNQKEVTVEFTVGKAELTVTADDKTIAYGDAAPAFTVTYDGFVNGDDEGDLGGTLAFACDYEKGDDVGTYPITPSGLTSDNYNITFVPGTLTVGKANYPGTVTPPTGLTATYGDTLADVTLPENDDGVWSWKDAGTTSVGNAGGNSFTLVFTPNDTGYNQVEVEATVTVGKAALTVTADNVTVAYGEPKPEFTAQINGFVNDDYEGDLTGTLEFDCAYAAGSPVGTYPIKPKGLTSNNYSISFVDGTLTVTENAVPMPTAPVGKTLTYNSGLQDLILPGSAEHGTMYYSLSQNGPWNAAVPQAKDAGVYTVWYKVVGDPGYSDTAPNSVTAVINKAPLTIKALDRRAYVGERMPAFAYDVVGLLGSDTLDKAPSFSCNANMNMPGTYVIRIFGAEAANYDISYVNGILTVEHRFVIPGYKITVVVVGKGEASASAGWADAGSVISVISKADEGYTLGSITVETESGRSVAMKDGKFTMPNDSVVVTVTFEKKGEPFYDVRPGDWFYDAVIWAYENGIMDGMDIGWFQPDGTVSRAMAVTVLYRMEGQPAVSGSSGFTDVVSGSWYDDAVTWASKNGIVLGVTEDTYRPNDPVTREQLAAILFRYADYKGYDRSASADLTGYADYAEVSAYAVPALRWACGCGIIDGSAGKLDPRSGATRAQLATMLMRFDKAAK